MSYETFLEEVVAELENAVECSIHVSQRSNIKNNGCVHKGILFDENGYDMSPTIYMDDYYDMYQDGKELTEIIGEILKAYKKARVMREFTKNWMQDFESLKDKIVFRMVNREKNSWIYDQVPHFDYCNMVLFFYVLLDLNESDESDGAASMMITNEHMEWWKLREDELYALATKNTKRLCPPELKTMKEMLVETLGFMAPAPELEEDYMYILTNKQRFYGASSMAFLDVLESARERIGSDYFILPSSVHEVILMPDYGNINRWDLVSMVREVNKSEVSEEEYLSDIVYYFSEKDGLLY